LAALFHFPLGVEAMTRNDEHVQPDQNAIESDRMLIENTAHCVRDLCPQMNAAALYIAVGREFDNLHEHLSKNSPHDKKRIGWKRAFSKQENKFGLSRRQAENYIAIYAAFFHCGNALPPSKLPQSLRPLLALAKLKLTTQQLQEACADGSIGPTSTEADIQAAAVRLNLVPRKEPTQLGTSKRCLEDALDVVRDAIESTDDIDHRAVLIERAVGKGAEKHRPQTVEEWRVELSDSLAEACAALSDTDTLELLDHVGQAIAGWKGQITPERDRPRPTCKTQPNGKKSNIKRKEKGTKHTRTNSTERR
jgi:hypothetical protein